jgi:vacuolar-type H+-ATPase subunit H
LNEKRIQEVIDIEKQADGIFSKAVSEAERIPQLAEQEAKALLENARQQAEKEAQALLANVQNTDETSKILDEAEETNKHQTTLAKHNFERTTTYIISRVVGRG